MIGMVMDTVDEAFFFSFVLPPSLPFSLSLLKARAQPARGGDSVDDMRRMEHQVVVV